MLLLRFYYVAMIILAYRTTLVSLKMLMVEMDEKNVMLEH
jgi:hypothetical protein